MIQQPTDLLATVEVIPHGPLISQNKQLKQNSYFQRPEGFGKTTPTLQMLKIYSVIQSLLFVKVSLQHSGAKGQGNQVLYRIRLIRIFKRRDISTIQEVG
jgi:hypothetical protein